MLYSDTHTHKIEPMKQKDTIIKRKFKEQKWLFYRKKKTNKTKRSGDTKVSDYNWKKFLPYNNSNTRILKEIKQCLKNFES